jgi:hypothetical protein
MLMNAPSLEDAIVEGLNDRCLGLGMERPTRHNASLFNDRKEPDTPRTC